MTIDTKELRRLAQAATPGPWEFWHGMIATDIDNDGGVVIAKRPTPSGGKLQARVDTNFQYIVAAYPAASLELLDRLEAAEKEGDTMRTKISDLTINVEYLGNLKKSYEELIGELQDERDALRAKIAEIEKQEPIGTALLCTRCSTPFDGDHYCPACGFHTAMEEHVYALPGAQPASDDEYVGWYCAHCQRGVDASEVTYHEQHEACGCVITDDRPPKSAPSIPEGWLRAIDEALVVAHIGVANVSDTFEQAREKLDNLNGFHVDVATDPAVNGGYKLMPVEPTHETLMDIVGAVAAPLSFREVRTIYDTVLAAPEVKP